MRQNIIMASIQLRNCGTLQPACNDLRAKPAMQGVQEHEKPITDQKLLL